MFCRWIAKRISEILGNEDDVVIELCFNLLEGSRYVSFPRVFVSLIRCFDIHCMRRARANLGTCL